MFIACHHRSQESRRHWLAGVLAFVVMALGALTVAPELHLALHDDAHSAEHSCAVELFAGGVTPVLAITMFAPVALLALGSITPVSRIAPATPAWSLPPGRGPPLM